MNNYVIENASTFEIEEHPAVATSSAYSTKGFWPRTASYLLDQVFLYIFVHLAGINAGLHFGAILVIFGDESVPVADNPPLDTAFGLLLVIVYYSIFEWLFGATPGKVLLRMRVVGLDGNRASLVRSLVRGATRPIDGLFFGLVALANMRGPLKQRWGDKLARTIVVSSGDPIIRNRRSWWWFLAAFVLNWLVVSLLLITNFVIAFWFS